MLEAKGPGKAMGRDTCIVEMLSRKMLEGDARVVVVVSRRSK